MEKDEIVVAAFSCSSNKDRGDRNSYIRNIEYLDPDLIFLADTICCGVDASSLADRPAPPATEAVGSRIRRSGVVRCARPQVGSKAIALAA